ncbi:MAG: hypothetical protein WAO55_15570 [Candidatus Manganitrophaceae bacterium]
MRGLNVILPCGKGLQFYLNGDQAVCCSNERVLTLLSDRGVSHFNGNRYFPDDGEVFLEALHDFYWIKGVSVEVV